jgi:primase-polymerase (primpol)-like protein
VCFRIEERGGKLTKVPYRVTGTAASVSNAATWTTYNAAATAVSSGRFNGVGFVFTNHDPYLGVDLDKVRDPETGLLDAPMRALVERLASYAEVSPSGTGVHVIVRARKPGDACRKKNVEMYDHDRFF